MSDSEGERLARLEVMVEQLTADVHAHMADHRSAEREAKEAKDMAKQSALLTAIGHRSDRNARLVAYIGGGFIIVAQIIQLVRVFV